MPVTATPAGNPGLCNPEQPVLPGAKSPSPLPESCLNQHIICPRTPTEPTTGTPVLTRTHAVNIPGEQKASIDHVMRDVNGRPVDLRACLCLPTEESSGSSESSVSVSQSSDSSSQSSDSSDNSLSLSSESSESLDCPDCDYKMVFRLSEYLSGGGCEFPVEIVDAENGHVRVNLEPKDTQCPGVYFGEFALVTCLEKSEIEAAPTGDTTVLFSNHMYVYIGRNLWNNRMNHTGPNGPPSISEIRLHLRDTEPSESFLLDNLAFSDEEIMQAIYLPVQYWNEIPPPIGTHTTANFPYRYHWLMAIAGYLFLTAAEQMRRNNLRYSASGVNIDDQDKEPNYEQAASRRLLEFREFVKRKKAQINLEGAYGGVGSTYRYIGHGGY